MPSPRFFRRLWTINGVGLLIVIIIILFQLSVEAVEQVGGWFRPDHERGLIVGHQQTAARELNLSIQHVKYDHPQRIGESSFYLAEVVVVDKRLPREVREAIESAGDISLQMIGATINVLFFSADRSDVRRLLESNAYIDRIDHPGGRRTTTDEPERPFILYKMALHDTNGDGRINDRDAQQYFLSDLTGRDLRQITPDTLDLERYWFADDYREIYFEEVEKDDSRRASPFILEQRTLYYYNVAEDHFGRFDALQDAFSEIQREFGDSLD